VYKELGYPVQLTEQYFDTVSTSLESENVVMDIRFPESNRINFVLDDEITSYLEHISEKGFSTAKRTSVVNGITEQMNDIINNYDSNPENTVKIIDQYQKTLNLVDDASTNAAKSNALSKGAITPFLVLSFFILKCYF